MRRLIHATLILVLLAACGGSGQARRETVPPGGAEPPAPPVVSEPPGPPPLPFATADWREVLPGGALGVVGVDVPVLLESELAGLGLAVTSSQGYLEALRQAAEGCGMAFPADIHTVVAGWYPGERVAAVSQGHFDQARARDCLEALAARGEVVVERDEIAGREAFAGETQGQRFWLMVPREGVALVTSTRALMEEILAAGTTRMGADRGEPSAWLARVAGQRPLWGAGVVPPGSELARSLMAVMSDRLSAPMTGMYGVADPSSGLDARIYLVMHGDADAGALVGRASEQLSFIRPGLALQGMGFLLDRLTLSTDGPLVQIRLALTPKQVARVRAKLAP